MNTFFRERKVCHFANNTNAQVPVITHMLFATSLTKTRIIQRPCKSGGVFALINKMILTAYNVTSKVTEVCYEDLIYRRRQPHGVRGSEAR